MSVSINQMIRAMHKARHEIEINQIGGLSAELETIFDTAERKLFRQRDRFFKGLSTNAQGEVIGSVKNIEAARKAIANVKEQVGKLVTVPGNVWSDKMVNAMGQAGRDLARVNLTTDFIPQAKIDAVFKHISGTERAILKVGRSDSYSIIGTIGDDINEFFRREMLNSVAEGIPVQGPGDTLSNRLFASGRLKAIPVYTKNGRTIMRSAKTRADAIARIESAKILNATHEDVTKQALGDEAVYRNSNPQDSRTTDICAYAAREKPMTLVEWSRSRFGRPPRLKPFHLCRSVLIGGMEEWFEDDGNPEPVQDATPPPQPENPKIKGPQDFDDIEDRLKYYAEGDNIARDIISEAAKRKRVERRLKKEMKSLEEKRVSVFRDRENPKRTELLHDIQRESDDVKAKINDLRETIRDYAAKVIGNADNALEGGLPIRHKKVAGAWESGLDRDSYVSLNNLLGKKSSLWPKIEEQLTKGRDFVNRLVHKGNSDVPDGGINYDIAVSDRRKVKTGGKMARAFQWSYDNIVDGRRSRGGICLDKTNEAKIVAHELGHLIETTVDGVYAASQKFIKYRTRGETARRMDDLFPQDGYGPQEFGRKDKFDKVWEQIERGSTFAPYKKFDVQSMQHMIGRIDRSAYYTGKTYQDGTELISMGMELLYQDPVTFARYDLEYFKFIVGILRGDLRYYP